MIVAIEQKGLPCDEQAEQVILGCLAWSENDSTPLLETRAVLTVDDFHLEKHRLIFTAACAIQDRGDVVNAVAIFQEISKAKRIEGLLSYLADQVRENALQFTLDQNLRRVRDLSMRRRLIAAAERVQHGAMDQTVTIDETLNQWAETVRDTQPLSNGAESLGEIMDGAGGLGGLLQKRTGILTPWPELNEVTGGWQDGDLVIIAARPSMGKTALMMNSAQHGAEQGKPTVIYSYEMSKESLLLRLLSTATRIPFLAIQSGNLTKTDRGIVNSAFSRLALLPLRIVEGAGKTPLALHCHADRLRRRGQMSVAYLDYLQKIPGGGKTENRNQEVAKITRELKNTAMQLKVPWVVLSQLSRALEARADKRPQMSDLRETGEIEQEADVISFLYRAEYYSRDRPELKGMAELILGKQRNGETCIIPLKFTAYCGQFESMGLREAA